MVCRMLCCVVCCVLSTGSLASHCCCWDTSSHFLRGTASSRWVGGDWLVGGFGGWLVCSFALVFTEARGRDSQVLLLLCCSCSCVHFPAMSIAAVVIVDACAQVLLWWLRYHLVERQGLLGGRCVASSVCVLMCGGHPSAAAGT